jgi:hypothetical protein
VPVLLEPDQHVEDFALGVDRPPEIDHSAVDFQIDLVQRLRGVSFRQRLRKSAPLLDPKWFAGAEPLQGHRNSMPRQ